MPMSLIVKGALPQALVVVMLAVSMSLLSTHLQHFHAQKLETVTRENICSYVVEEALEFIQRHQLLRAQEELLDLDNCTPPYQPATGYVHTTTKNTNNYGRHEEYSMRKEDNEIHTAEEQRKLIQETIESNKQKMIAAIEANRRKLSYFLFKKELQNSHQRPSDGIFYKHSFGAIDVWTNKDNSTKLSSSLSSSSSSSHIGSNKLSYYIIWKNGHEYIRSLLLRYSDPEYARRKSLTTAKFVGRTEASCRLGYCVEYLSKDLEDITFPIDQKRFAFTFTRNPLSRFISAYTEIEYRFDGKSDKELPLQFPIGSVDRVKEFIIFLLSGGGSKAFMGGFDGDIYHIMPAIGTLLLANRKEYKSIHLYRIESFEEEIGRLAKDSGFHELLDLYQQVPYNKTHASASYHNVTTRAAMTLLYPHSKNLTLGVTSESEIRWNSSSSVGDKRFLKAICRIYYSDFLCFGYDFPLNGICDNLHEEASSAIERVTSMLPSRIKSIISAYMSSKKDLSQLLCPSSIKSSNDKDMDVNNEIKIDLQEQENLLNIVQAEMFRLSRYDMLVECDLCDNFSKDYIRRWREMLSENGYRTSSKDMDFYNHHFGIASVEKRAAQTVDVNSLSKQDETSNDKSNQNMRNPPTTLVYYRIWKNANDNIRRLLFHYSSLSNFDETTSSPCNVVHSEDEAISDNSCIGNMNIQYPSKNGALKSWILSTSRRGDTSRFPFTFMRNPIDRFISGYTEIEYRLYRKIMKNGNNWLPLYSKVGTIERLKEFIRYVVAANGSRKILRDGNMAHIAPQIGTLVMATNLEVSKLNIYKFENFYQEWLRLANDSGFSDTLTSVYRPRFQGHHRSSFDPYNTTYISKLFFEEYLTQDTVNITFDGQSGHERNSRKRPAEVYLRAICRVYLMDFICGRYELPPVCAKIIDEIDRDLMDFNVDREKKKTFLGMMKMIFSREILPVSFLKGIAGLLCYFHKSPSCNAWVVYGYSGDEED